MIYLDARSRRSWTFDMNSYMMNSNLSDVCYVIFLEMQRSFSDVAVTYWTKTTRAPRSSHCSPSCICKTSRVKGQEVVSRSSRVKPQTLKQVVVV